jgi:hypothetical protein
MKAVVRPLEGTDLEGFDRLRTLLYPDRPETFDTNRYFSIWRWLGTHPLADQMQRSVVATEEGEVVGHLAALPQYYRINGQQVVAHTPADYMVLPEYGFHAITLMRKFFRTCENCVACDVSPAAISVETGLGAEEVGRLQHAAKLQNVAGLPALPTSIPPPITQLCNWGLQAVDRALLATIPVDHLRVEELEGFDETFDELFESVAAAVACVPEKDAAFLRWRYGPSSPQSGVTVLGVREGETLLGYAVLWVKVGGDTPRYASNLLDLMTRPGDVHHPVPVPRVAHLAPGEGRVAVGLLAPQRAAPQAAGQVCGSQPAQGGPGSCQLVVRHRRRRSEFLLLGTSVNKGKQAEVSKPRPSALQVTWDAQPLMD